MSRYLSWVCSCCFFGPSYAPLHSDEPHHYDLSRHAATVELAEAHDVESERFGETVDDEQQSIYTIDDDAQLVQIAPLPPRRARASLPSSDSVHNTEVADPANRSPTHAEAGRPSLPPLIIDSAPASQTTSVFSSPASSPASRRPTTATHSQLSTPSSSAAAVTTAAESPIKASAARKRSSPGSSQSSAPITTVRSVHSPSSSSRVSSSSSSSSLRARVMSARALSSTAAMAKQFDYSPTVLLAAVLDSSSSSTAAQQHELTIDELDAGDELSNDATTREEQQNGHSAQTEEQRKQDRTIAEPLKRAVSSRVEEEKQAEEDGPEALLVKGVSSSPVIQIPSPRHRQQSTVTSSPALTDPYLRTTDSSLSTTSMSPSVAPTSPGESVPGSPSSASLSSSFSSVASGVSLSSSLASSTSPRSSPFVASLLSSSHPTPIQLQLDSHTPASDSLPTSAATMDENKSHEPHAAEKQPALSPPHQSSHRRLSSTPAIPTTTATAAIAPPATSIRTTPPSPAKDSAKDSQSSTPAAPSIPVALPPTPAVPAVRFKKGENPLLTLNIPKGKLSVEHIASIIALFSPPPVSSSSSSPVSALLSTLASHLTYIHLFNFLLSAPRTVSSAVFKHFSHPILKRHKPPNPRPSPNAQIGLLLLQFLTDYLVSIATSSTALTFTFAFPRQSDSMTLDVPTPDMFVLESRHPTEPTLVHPLNVVRKADSEVRRIVFSRVVRVMLGKDRGIVGLGSGDLSVKKVFSFSCDMRYERRVGEVDVDGSGRQVVEDRDGKVRVEGGHYVLARYDDWLVVTVLGQQVQIGLPRFTRVNE